MVDQKSPQLAIAITVVVLWFAFLWMGNRGGASPSGAPGIGSNVTGADNQGRLLGKKLSRIVREVTAYNVGVREQTSDDPCIGATGIDLCEMVERGLKVCAANFVALETILKIEKYGECVVMDRMHKRYSHRVDIAMKEDEVEEARQFGLQKRLVEVKR